MYIVNDNNNNKMTTIICLHNVFEMALDFLFLLVFIFSFLLLLRSMIPFLIVYFIRLDRYNGNQLTNLRNNTTIKQITVIIIFSPPVILYKHTWAKNIRNITRPISIQRKKSLISMDDVNIFE